MLVNRIDSCQNNNRLDDLFYRRQFLLGPATFNPNGKWDCFPLFQGAYLSIHPDLDHIMIKNDERQIILLGLVVDTTSPKSDMSEIASKLLDSAPDISRVINNTNSLAGRWIVIFQDKTKTYVFTDPCGFRQVFYISSDNGIWIGSQPEILKVVTRLEVSKAEELIQFLKSDEFAKNESAWVGNKTYYCDCYHLLPNHYLDLQRVSQRRFYSPKFQNLGKQSLIIDRAASLLQGAMEGITNKKKVIQALTAGWDSRVLLAASRNYCNKIDYYSDRMGVLSENSPDVWVPKQLAKYLGISFTVRNSKTDPPSWFVSLQSNNVSGARVLPKSRMIYSHFCIDEGLVNINGNGSEICRNFYDKYSKSRKEMYSPLDLAKLLGYPSIHFVERELDDWLTDIGSTELTNTKITDMLYWEQRLGNWGAQFPAEQDTAIDEFSPFNCRLLLDTLLSSPKHTRVMPNYLLYRDLIRAMWPEVLRLPINPPKNLKQFIHQIKSQIT